jgi:hypothetical protein
MASRFWVGGTGAWDAVTTTHWAATSNGAGGQSVPSSADTVTFDGSSGGGTVTVNFGGTISIQSLNMGAFTGTFDNSANNNNIAVSATGSAFNLSGSGTRTINLGSATYTMSATAATFNIATVTGLTLSAASATISFTGATGTRTMSLNGAAGHTFGAVSFGASSGAGVCFINAACTIGTLNITAPNYVQFPAGGTVTVSNSLAWAGSSGSEITLASSSFGTVATVGAAASSALSWCAVRDMTFTGSPTATNSFDLLHNSGITIDPPGGGGGVSRARAFAGM